MDTRISALVLTGRLLPGHEADSVWPALATYFRMDRATFDSQVLARVPMTIKEGDDLDKLHGLRDGAIAAGAEAVVVPVEGAGVFVLPGDTPRGPVPRTYVAERVGSGEWPASLRVAPVGSTTWTTWSEFAAPTPPAAPAAAPMTRAKPLTPESKDLGSTYIMPRVDAAAMAAGAAVPPAAGSGAAADGGLLPPGDTVHAGFWRRCAAFVLDTLVLVIPIGLLRFLFHLGNSDWLGTLVVIVAVWLYFALQESSAAQATPGKRLMDLKVTDDHGRPIGFGRATGRHFGKIVSALILYVGYLLAGWTPRKQALHDMMASCCVVFRAVEPGQPVPSVRAPMPWYGWVLNALPLLGLAAVFWAGAALLRAFGM